MACRCPAADQAPLHELHHTVVVEAGTYPELRQEAYPGHYRDFGWELRRCPECATWWWMQLTTTDHPTYDHGDETKVLAVVHDRHGVGLRCPDEAQARALIPWYPDLFRAAERFRRANPRDGSGDPGLAGLAHAALLPLFQRHPGACRLDGVIELADRIRHWRAADVLIAPLLGRMRQLVAQLEDRPDDPPAVAELTELQRRCAAARTAEREPDFVTVELCELWNVALAAAFQARYELQQLRPRLTPQDAPGLALAIALQRTIESSWRAFMRSVHPPTPAVELDLLHRQLSELDPHLMPFDPAAWDQPERIAMRIRTLMAKHGLGWRRHHVLDKEVEDRLGLPPTCDRSGAQFRIRRGPPR